MPHWYSNPAAEMTRLRMLAGKLFQRQVLMRAAGLFGSAVVSRGSQLVLAVLIARKYGPHDYGTFVFATGTAMLCSFLAALGWPNLMNRLIPVFRQDAAWSHLKGLLRGADIVGLIGSSILAIILVAIGFFIPHLAHGLRYAALLIFPFVISVMRRQQLVAVKRSALGLMFDQGFASLLLIIALLLVPLSLGATILGFALGMIGSCAIANFLVRKQFPAEMHVSKAGYRLKHWFAMAFPMMVGQSAKLVMSRMDIFLLAPLAGLTEAGLYGAAFRITYIFTFPQFVIGTVTMPLFSEAFAAGDIARVRRLLRYLLVYAVATTTPFLVVLLLWPSWIMKTLFGSEFASAGMSLAILSVGQVFTAMAQPYSAILMMGGREKQFGIMNAVALVLNLLGCVMLIPAYGALGAAMVTSGTGMLLYVMQIWQSRTLLREGATEGEMSTQYM